MPEARPRLGLAHKVRQVYRPIEGRRGPSTPSMHRLHKQRYRLPTAAHGPIDDRLVGDLVLAALDAGPGNDITVPMGPELKVTFAREAFVHEWIMPNLYFHVTAAYLILRRLGLDVGKKDYLIGLARHIEG